MEAGVGNSGTQLSERELAKIALGFGIGEGGVRKGTVGRRQGLYIHSHGSSFSAVGRA